MIIDEQLLSKLETLSSLKIEPEKKEEILTQLSNIVNFFENLNELDLENEKATCSTAEGGTTLREDEIQNDEDIIDIILKNAPNSDGRFFKVPSIIE